MTKEKFLNWLKTTGIRVLRTMIQVALGYLTVGLTIKEVDWLGMLSVSAVAGLYSLFTNIISPPPEAANDGEIIIHPQGDDLGTVEFSNTVAELAQKRKVTLTVTKVDEEDYDAD